MYLFTDKALNNLVYHRRCLFILIYQLPNHKPIIWKFNKRKKALKFHKTAMRDTKYSCHLIKVRPNNYKPQSIIH